MNTSISLENLHGFPVLFPERIENNSSSLIQYTDIIIEEDRELEDKFFILKKDIGDELFNRLSYEQKRFIVDVSGTINLGKTVDINAIYNRIEKLDYE